jgi:hypothetical protein
MTISPGCGKADAPSHVGACHSQDKNRRAMSPAQRLMRHANMPTRPDRPVTAAAACRSQAPQRQNIADQVSTTATSAQKGRHRASPMNTPVMGGIFSTKLTILSLFLCVIL